jgi:hypothetical protein
MSQPSSNSPQQIIQAPCTGVLVQLTIKSGINPQTFMPHMPAEVWLKSAGGELRAIGPCSANFNAF